MDPRMGLKRFSAILASLALAGCASSSAPDLCGTPVTLTFTASPRPTFSWAPNCRVDNVLVEIPLASSTGFASDVTWQIAARADGVGADAPLWYGVAPLFMRELVSPEPLQAGRFYRVRIYANDVMVGELNFQHWPPD